MKNLQSLFTEGSIARALNEEDDSASHQRGESGDSIDSQVDRYLAEYETDAKKVDGGENSDGDMDVATMESVEWRSLIRGVILEAGESDKDETDAGDDAPGADALTGADTGKLTQNDLDVEKFANDVVRLIQNYDSLLEVRNTLMRRAISFLKKSYEDDVIKAFQDTLRDDHGMEPGNDSDSTNSEKFPAPAADRASGSAQAGPGGTGPV